VKAAAPGVLHTITKADRMSAEDQMIIERIGIANLRRKERRVRGRNFRVALLFLAPAVILTSLVLLSPILFNVYLSLTRWQKFKGLDQWAGLDNYQTLLGHPQFAAAVSSTIIWVAGSLILPMALGLLLALALRGIPFEGVFKTIIFLPRVIAPTSIGVLWYYVYAPHGLLNSGLSIVTQQPIDIGWLYQSDTILPAIIGTYVWQNVGLVMVLLLLGLAAIPTDPIEAARMDGASPSQVFFHIVLPLLTPTLLVVSMLSILAGFGAFDLLWVMGISYPGQRTLALSVYMYFEGFGKSSWAYSAAIAVILGAISIVVTWLQAYMQSRAEKLRT
jgi:multiple sugar transport system permease protein